MMQQYVERVYSHSWLLSGYMAGGGLHFLLLFLGRGVAEGVLCQKSHRGLTFASKSHGPQLYVSWTVGLWMATV